MEDELNKLGFKHAEEAQIDDAISDEDIRGCVDEAFIHEGDLRVEGDLSLYDGAAVIVTGNLDVTGSVLTDETATLIVKGNLNARHLFLEGNLEIHGNATLRGVVYGFYEAGMSYVHGKTKAQAAVIGNHCWEPNEEEYDVDVRFANHHKLISGDPEKLRALMGDKGFAEIARLIGVSDKESPTQNGAWGLKPFADVAP